MTIYETGHRVALVHTSDPHTDLRPGDTGTVRRHDLRLHTVPTDFDSGSSPSMCLDAGGDPPATGAAHRRTGPARRILRYFVRCTARGVLDALCGLSASR